MVRALLLAVCGFFPLLSRADAAIITYTDFTLNGASATTTVGGITATVTAVDILGAATVSQSNTGTANYLGVNGPSNQNTGNVNQRQRIANGQSLTLSFSVPVQIDFLGFNNLISPISDPETALLSTSDNAFTNLSGYSDPANLTGQTDISAEGLVWGYTSPSFGIKLTTGSGNNLSQDVYFGLNGSSAIILPAGQTITIAASGTSGGGFGLNSIGVTSLAVPEPSTCALLAFSGMGLVILMRRRWS